MQRWVEAVEGAVGRAEFTGCADLETASWQDLRSAARIGRAEVAGRAVVAAGRGRDEVASRC